MALGLADFSFAVVRYLADRAPEVTVAAITIAGCIVAVALICRTSRTRYIGE